MILYADCKEDICTGTPDVMDLNPYHRIYKADVRKLLGFTYIVGDIELISDDDAHALMILYTLKTTQYN